MIETEETAGETAISYADQFVDAAVAKLDATFGKGYAKDNPALMQAYLAACAENLSTCIQAALGAQELSGVLEGLMADDDETEH